MTTEKQIAAMMVGDKIEIVTTYGKMTVTRTVKAKSFAGRNEWSIDLDGQAYPAELNARDVANAINLAPLA